MAGWWIRGVLIGMACAGLAACDSKQASNPAPPRMTTPVTLIDQPSTIRLPVGVPLQQLEKAINAEVPVLLHRIDEPQQTCVKTKSKLLPDISCRLVGSVRRGPIRLSGAGDALLLTIPIATTVSAENIGKVIKRETADGAIDVKARVRLGLTRTWQPTAKMDADYAWTKKVGIDFLGQRINFSSKVDPKITALLNQLEHKLPALLARVQVREKIQPLWAKGFTAIRVKSEPLIWVRFTPQQIGYSGYRVADGKLVVDFSARARTETLFGDRPPDPPVTPLPDLMGPLPPGGINVHVPILVNYAVLEDAARKELVSGDYKAIALKHGGTVKAQFQDVTIYGTPNNGAAVGLDVSLVTPKGVLSAKGRVWFTAEPVVDIEKKMVSIRDLKLAGETDNRIFNMLLDAINGMAVRERLTQAIRYDFGKDYADGLRKADQWLEAEPLEGFVFKGDLVSARIRDVRIAPDGLLVEADASATGAMTYAPQDAAVLVAKRKARRLAREREKAAATRKSLP